MNDSVNNDFDTKNPQTTTKTLMDKVGLFNDNFKKNLVTLSIDDIKKLDLNALQDFFKQKEGEFKVDYNEFIAYKKLYGANINNPIWEDRDEISRKRVWDKWNEMVAKYDQYIYMGEYYDDMPKDLTQSGFSQEEINKIYEIIRNNGVLDNDHTIRTRIMDTRVYNVEAGIAKTLPEILAEIKADNSNIINHPGTITKQDIKFIYIKTVIVLRYLLYEAEKHQDTENIKIINQSIEDTLDMIRQIDDPPQIQELETETISNDIINTIK